ncbi:MAG: transporter substrate-binding protein [Xanthobacteraceae bacterium]|jgi:iron complex transport system substrate-binding protein|nr:transporter substrate-binding protein [Xanthobacteraceae bacterium]
MRSVRPHWTRRQALYAATALAAGVVLPARASLAGVPRVATLDWAILETLLALGAPPVAATELVQFRDIAVEPAVPASVADLGLRGLPNLETLLLARPEIIFNSSFYAALEPRLARIAPVESFTLFEPGQRPYAPVEAMTRVIAARLGRTEAADGYIAGTEAEMAALRTRLRGGDGRAVLPINFGDARHFRTFGFDSMLGEALQRLGLANAWTNPTSYSASAPVGLEALAGFDDVWIAIIGPTPPEVVPILAQSAFWNALPAVRAGRALFLGSVNPFGALPSMVRFARLLTDALPFSGGGGNG